MVPGVPREAQQLVCVCANEFGDAADCGEYRRTAGASGNNRNARQCEAAEMRLRLVIFCSRHNRRQSGLLSYP
jgi:hypothetical protein